MVSSSGRWSIGGRTSKGSSQGGGDYQNLQQSSNYPSEMLQIDPPLTPIHKLGHYQQMETGGIQHSGDEQGRAPLESPSSVSNPVSASKNHGEYGGAAAFADHDTEEKLTVIQETTFE